MVGVFTSNRSLVHILLKKAAMKTNIRLQKWLFKTGWIIINAIWPLMLWLFSALVKTKNLDVDMEAEIVAVYHAMSVDR